MTEQKKSRPYDSRRVMEDIVRIAHSNNTVSFQFATWVLGQQTNELSAVRDALETCKRCKDQLEEYRDYLLDEESGRTI